MLSYLLNFSPVNMDALANLGIAYLQRCGILMLSLNLKFICTFVRDVKLSFFFSGNLELSAKCFQELVLKDQNHPAALVNYAAMLLCKYGSVISGALHFVFYYFLRVLSTQVLGIVWLL